MRQMSSLVPFIQTQRGSWRSGDVLTPFLTSDLGLSDENSPILKRVGKMWEDFLEMDVGPESNEDKDKDQCNDNDALHQNVKKQA